MGSVAGVAPPSGQGAEPVEVTASGPPQGPPEAGLVVRLAIAGDTARLLAHDPVVRHGMDPEGVHQARVATRRLRSQLRTFEPILTRRRTRRLREELKWLGGLLGAVRDLDVLRMRLASADQDGTGVAPAVLARVLARVDRERDVADRRLTAAMNGKPYRRLVRALATETVSPGLRKAAAEPPSEVLAPAVRRPWTRLAQAVTELPPDPADEQLHHIRILAKRSRYAAEAATSFMPEACDELAKRLAKLQDTLGELNDGSRASAWLQTLRGEVAEAPPDGTNGRGTPPELVSGVGLLVAREQRRMVEARQEWPTKWQKVLSAAVELGWSEWPAAPAAATPAARPSAPAGPAATTPAARPPIAAGPAAVSRRPQPGPAGAGRAPTP